MLEDPREKTHLTAEDVLGLNFIRKRPPYVFRKHHRSGLRSHLFQVLDPREVQKESDGLLINGLQTFPKAKPLKMLRIFRARFQSLIEAEEELKRFKTIDAFLAPCYLARSNEFLVDFASGKKDGPILCGLQEYVEGEIIDPWGIIDKNHLFAVLRPMSKQGSLFAEEVAEEWFRSVQEKAREMILRLKELIRKEHHVPDLAGSGNLLLTGSGHMKLVDINNISEVHLDSTILLDDREYPVCDKSIEALSHLEEKLLERPVDRNEPVYRVFLDPGRMREVRSLELRFYQSMELRT